MKVQCCVCNRVRKESGWIRERGAVLAPESVSHGYCPACLARAVRWIRAEKRHRAAHPHGV